MERRKNMEQTMPPPMQQQPMQQLNQKNGAGTAALILGIVGLCLFWLWFIGIILGIIAVILGAVAYWGKWKDAKLGLAGFILGLITIIIVIVFIVIAFMLAASFYSSLV
jgi:uncharacterized membrane protein